MSTVLRKRVDPKPKKLGATRLSQMEDKENKPPMAAAKCKQVAEVCTPPQREALRPRQDNEQQADPKNSPMVVASDGDFFYCNDAGKDEQGQQAPAGTAGASGSPRDAWGGLGGLISSLQTRAAQLLSEEPVTLFENVSVSGAVSMPTVESVLNQSIDAINVVGRVALAVGTAIDNAIEGGVASLERMHNYDTQKETGSGSKAPQPQMKTPKGAKGKRVFSTLTPAIDGWDAEWANPRAQPGSPASPMTMEAGTWSWSAGRSPSPEQLKAEQLQKSVEHLRDEFSRSKAECEKLTEVMRELAGEFSEVDAQPRPSASQKPVKITRISSSKSADKAAAAASEPGSPEEEGEDPLAEQVRIQMELLVQEKARLAMENARLQRENKNLQELLQYHMGDDELEEETPVRGGGAAAGPMSAAAEQLVAEASAACSSTQGEAQEGLGSAGEAAQSAGRDEGNAAAVAAVDPDGGEQSGASSTGAGEVPTEEGEAPVAAAC